MTLAPILDELGVMVPEHVGRMRFAIRDNAIEALARVVGWDILPHDTLEVYTPAGELAFQTTWNRDEIIRLRNIRLNQLCDNFWHPELGEMRITDLRGTVYLCPRPAPQ